MKDTSGLGYEKPYAFFDPDTQSWRMSGDISLWEEQPLLEKLPPSGMTRNGVLFQQPRWEPITAETESLSWPTPRANVAMASTITPEIANNPKRQPNLETVVGRRMWPTPTTMDALPPRSQEAVERHQANNRPGRTTPPTLKDAVAHPTMWPTPKTTDHKTNASPSEVNRHSPSLGAMAQMYPTPRHGSMCGGSGSAEMIEAKFSAGEISAEERQAMRSGNGGKLNPRWVEWLMGFPLGWTDLEG